MFTRLALCLALALPLAASAQESILPVITEVLDNPAGTQITINGTGFGPKTPQVSLAGTNLTVLKASNTSILATVPASIAAGSYALSVTNTATHLLGLFSAAIPPAVGPAGVQGSPGVQGPQGLQGMTGAQGPAGAAGLQGPVGSTGKQGATGPQGPIGMTGPQGPAGINGTNGTNGAQGPQGAVGPAGPAGSVGPAGSTGPQGPSGPTGAAGPSIATQVYSANISVAAQAEGFGSGSVIGQSAFIPTQYPALSSNSLTVVPNACTASNLNVKIVGDTGLVFPGQDLVSISDSNGYTYLSCFPSGGGASTGCSEASSYAVPAGAQLAVSFAPVGNFAGSTLLVSFTCQ